MDTCFPIFFNFLNINNLIDCNSIRNSYFVNKKIGIANLFLIAFAGNIIL